MYVHPKGNPTAPVWIILNKPLSGDEDKGYLFSSPQGYVFDKMLAEAGITDYYVIVQKPDTANTSAAGSWESSLHTYKPPIIIPLGSAGNWLVEEMRFKYQKKNYNPDMDSELSKYAGSLLSSNMGNKLDWPHYIIPTFEPMDVIRQWKIRDIVVSCDLSKAAAELEYWRNNGHSIQPLPKRTHKITFESFDELLSIIDDFLNYDIISNDIETIYPKAPTKTQPSQFYGILPGYPVVIGLAPSIDFGISFDCFRDSVVETRELWKHLAKLFWEVPSLGQNFFNFDANYYEALGFRFPLEKCRDTLIQHHILWPELKHTLQFQTRQYTRERYYKDEGHGWSTKNTTMLKTYNVKDVCVTMEIYLAQLEELKQRGLE